MGQKSQTTQFKSHSRNINNLNYEIREENPSFTITTTENKKIELIFSDIIATAITLSGKVLVGHVTYGTFWGINKSKKKFSVKFSSKY